MKTLQVTGMSGVTSQKVFEGNTHSYGLQPLELADIPSRHPVSCFARRYSNFQDDHLLPDELVLLAEPNVRQLLRWTRHVEPVELDGLIDFYVISQGDDLEISNSDHMCEGWMSDTLDKEFVESRYHEVIAASILRKPMFSRGAIPTKKRAFLMQYRGIFPLFAETHSRLRLAIVAAETYIEVNDVPE